MNTDDAIARDFPGLQVALFELIWPVFDWIDAIHLRSDATTCDVYVQAARIPSQGELDDCERLLSEIFDAAIADPPLLLRINYQEDCPVDTGYQEMISPEIFRLIAKDVAPWRLESGR